MARIIFLIFTCFMACFFNLYGEDYLPQYADIPYFNILPADSISKAFKTFGKSKIFETTLAHNYVLYFDYEKQIGLIFTIYQADKTSICEVTIRKEQGKNAIEKLHELASLGSWKQGNSKLNKPKNIKLPIKLSLKGLKLDLSPEEVEGILKTKLVINDNKASIHWEKTVDNQIRNYGGMKFIFDNGKLISLSWYGVDP